MIITNTRENNPNERLSESSPNGRAKDTSVATKLIFGVNSKVKANTILQNNLTEFEWVVRNKLYPAFWGRNIVGENALDKEEIDFLQNKGCQIAPIYCASGADSSEEQGKIEAQIAIDRAKELGVSDGIAIFLEIPETFKISREYMRGYAKALLDNGYTPAWKLRQPFPMKAIHKAEVSILYYLLYIGE